MRAPSPQALALLSCICQQFVFATNPVDEGFGAPQLLHLHQHVKRTGADGQQQMQLGGDKVIYREACPPYERYAKYPHHPLSEGEMQLPFQRPVTQCRTFISPAVDKVIADLSEKMVDKDLARIFENAFPNTLDTTVRWHVDGSVPIQYFHKGTKEEGKWEGAQSFIVTGDINAEWLRDSTNQLQQYQGLAKSDPTIYNLILGAINTQAEFVIESPYCNAFQPPPPSRLQPSPNGQDDAVHPTVEPTLVFECKYELDSLAHFLSLTNQFYSHTGSTAFLNKRWILALETLLQTLREQSEPTFDPRTGAFNKNVYTFRRRTDTGTETLNLGGIGNPLAGGTSLIRSAFRPSDDATILGFFIPANAMLCVELKRTAEWMRGAGRMSLAEKLTSWAKEIEHGIWTYGVSEHPVYGRVFAFEVDGYGSRILMDDANLPSLLALPLMGFCEATDPVYLNTRRMILDKKGNPYFLTGKSFRGIGGPHVGVEKAWPMSLLVQAMTSSDDSEITTLLETVKRASLLGLIHESVNVNNVKDYTRPWFAWANSVFAQTILDLAHRKPHLLFGRGAEPYILGSGSGGT